MKITSSDRQKIIAFYGSKMSVSEITRQLNINRDKKLQFSRQAVSKILNEFKNGEKVAESGSLAEIEYKKVARATYDKAITSLSYRMDKASVQDLIKTIEYYEKLYHFSEEQNENNVERIEISVVDASGNNNDTKN